MFNGLRRRAAFTLIEIIGVLAVLSILAAMILPNVIQEINRASGDAEENNLKTIAAGLENYITQYRVIPGTMVVAASGTIGTYPYLPAVPDWSTAIASATGLALAKVTTNERGNTRYYYWDANGFPTIPFSQGSDGAGALTGTQTRPRIIIVSSVGANITGPASGSMVNTNFQALWDWDGYTVTSLTTAGITGISTSEQAKDVRMQRINLDHMFNTISLSNRKSTSPGRTSFVAAASGTVQPVITVSGSATAPLTVSTLRYNVYAFQTNSPDTSGTPISVAISSGAASFGTVATANAGSGGFVDSGGCLKNGGSCATGVGATCTGATGWCMSGLTASAPLNVTMTLTHPLYAIWVANTVYFTGQVVSSSPYNGFYYIASVGGTSAATAPAWPVAAGSTVVDNTVTWMTVSATSASASGTVDVEVDYSATTGYSLDDDGLKAINVDVPATIYALEKTKLNLYERDTSTTPISVYFVNASDSFWFSPGPPAMWGR
ncbi:MAG: type II secretion system protein [Nitrospinae bacterium]|nr:type II secretion system protein [Nitrospinota bacterium]